VTAALVPVLTWHSIGLVASLFTWRPIGPVRAILIAIALWAVYLAIGIAILRHRLYDIDRLINRTLVYGVLTAILGVVYAGGVFVVGQLLNPGGGESGLAVWRPRRWRWRRCFGPCGDGCRRRSTGASTAVATTRPRP
jgi:hypothetical protein